MTYFGKNDSDDSSANNFAGSYTWFIVDGYTCPGAGNQTLKTLDINVYNMGTSGNFRLALYTTGGDKVAEWDNQYAPSGTGWLAVTSLSPADAILTGGTNYLLLASQDGDREIYAGTVASNEAQIITSDYTGGFPASIVVSGNHTREYCIRAGVEAASGVVLAGTISSASSTSSFIPYIYHYLINNTVSGVSSLPSLLPYLYHYLINNVVSAASSLGTLMSYVYHYLVNNTVDAVSSLVANLDVILAQVYQYLAGAVDAVSSLASILPEIWHYLVNNTISAVSSLRDILPYITHRLLPDTMEIVSSLVANLDVILGPVYQYLAGAVDGVSSLIGNLERWGLQMFNAAVDAISTTWGNLTRIPGSLTNKLRIYMKIHRGRF